MRKLCKKNFKSITGKWIFEILMPKPTMYKINTIVIVKVFYTKHVRPRRSYLHVMETISANALQVIFRIQSFYAVSERVNGPQQQQSIVLTLKNKSICLNVCMNKQRSYFFLFCCLNITVTKWAAFVVQMTSRLIKFCYQLQYPKAPLLWTSAKI